MDIRKRKYKRSLTSFARNFIIGYDYNKRFRYKEQEVKF